LRDAPERRGVVVGRESMRSAVRASNGIATFDDLAVDKAGAYTLRATATGAGSVTSSAFVITTATGR
jgi:hypothetical protein